MPRRWMQALFAGPAMAIQERLQAAARALARRVRGDRPLRAAHPEQRARVRVDAHTLDGVAVELTIVFRHQPSRSHAGAPEHASDALLRMDDVRVRSAESITQTVRACVRTIRYEDLQGRRVQIVGALAHELARLLQRLRCTLFDARVSTIRLTQAPSPGADLSASLSQAQVDPTDSSSEGASLSRWESEGGGSGPIYAASSTGSTRSFR